MIVWVLAFSWPLALITVVSVAVVVDILSRAVGFGNLHVEKRETALGEQRKVLTFYFSPAGPLADPRVLTQRLACA
jgi:hypothetical protein